MASTTQPGPDQPNRVARASRKRKQKSPDGTMPLMAHLVELRNRIFLAAIGILAGGVGGWFLYQPALAEMVKPLYALSRERGQIVSINFGTVASAFDFQLKLSVFLGIFISSPWWIYQIWAFVTPGLTKRERRYVVGFFIASVPLFFAGAWLAFWFVPTAIRFFVQFTPQGGTNIIAAQDYLEFVMQVVLAFGLSFLLPVILVGLNFLGILRARHMIRGWRWIVVLSFTFGAIATPTGDVVSMFMLAAPLLLLFSIAVGISAIHDRIRDGRRSPDDAIPDDQASPLPAADATPELER